MWLGSNVRVKELRSRSLCSGEPATKRGTGLGNNVLALLNRNKISDGHMDEVSQERPSKDPEAALTLASNILELNFLPTEKAMVWRRMCWAHEMVTQNC